MGRAKKGRQRRQRFVGVGGDVGGRGIILIFSIDNLFCNDFRYGGDLLCRSSVCNRGYALWPGGVL
jgi:hypothetical protein